METDTPKRPNKAIIAIVVVALLAIIAAAVLLLNREDTPASTTSESAPATTADTTPTTPSTPSAADTDSAYKDGTYKATGNYRSPGGSETVDVTVTLAGGVITSTEFEGHATSRDARDYQSRFEGGYKSLVVGKKIDDVSLSRVAGSSLTSNGFNNALEQIKSDAKA